jgi:hypothetical protein
MTTGEDPIMDALNELSYRECRTALYCLVSLFAIGNETKRKELHDEFYRTVESVKRQRSDERNS